MNSKTHQSQDRREPPEKSPGPGHNTDASSPGLPTAGVQGETRPTEDTSKYCYNLVKMSKKFSDPPAGNITP